MEANNELEQITPALRAHPDVLQIRAKVYLAAGKWEMVVEIGRALNELLPTKPFGVLHQAHALRQLARTTEACTILLPAAEKFPKEWRIAYALASYYSTLGNRREAYDWLERAIARLRASRLQSFGVFPVVSSFNDLRECPVWIWTA